MKRALAGGLAGGLLLLLLAVACRQPAAGPAPPSPPSAGATATVTATPQATTTLAPPLLSTLTPRPTPAGASTAPAPVPAPATPPPAAEPGALIAVSMPGRVGVLLDEFPPDLRPRLVDFLLAQPEEAWLARARRQVRLAEYRLNFRNFVTEGKGQLPLPPPSLWQIQLDPAGPFRETVQGHDLVLLDYTFAGTLLSDPRSPGEAEPALAAVGGRWEEPFVLPLDPDLLLQRTGNACLNEGGFPPNSYDSENAWQFFDYACLADSGGPAGCHRTRLPPLSCREAMANSTGELETGILFRRLAWDQALAAAVRLGPANPPEGADLAVVAEDLGDYRLVYRYIAQDDCAVAEHSVGGTGWRRLLQFSATVQNVGRQALHIGPVQSEDPALNVFRYNSCHDHFHFSNYGDFAVEGLTQATLDGSVGNAGKQAFCVESTGRLSNNASSPLTHPYSCLFQGIQAGWVDEYRAGLDSQWLDITDLAVPDAGITVTLGFAANPDGFLCEGIWQRDANGEPLWQPSGQVDEDGHPISRPACQFVPGWQANNTGTKELFVPATGSFVTMPCRQGEIGPRRNCGFVAQADDLTCPTWGAETTLRVELPAQAAPQVLRLCPASSVLGVGLACTEADSLANAIIGPGESAIPFTCPLARDAQEPGGRYALYTAPLLPGDAAAAPLIPNP